jgi:hypothetical protein
VIEESVSGLRGLGHFTLWFLIGYVVFLIAKVRRHSNVKLHIWGPFFPFVLGTLAAVPYALQLVGLISRETALQPGYCLVLLYPLVEQSDLALNWLGNFHANVVFVGVAYTHLVVMYVRRIKRNKRLKADEHSA